MMKLTKGYRFFPFDRKKVIQTIGQKGLVEQLQKMLLIRHLEEMGEAAYYQGKIGGFFHSYIGQEAIQVGCVAAASRKHWYTTTYRCHALALLLGATVSEIMAEFYGKATGNARGRGGSMHLFAEHLLGGLAIVGGHIPIATGAAFTIKYLNQKGLVSFCFLGDGAVAQGTFHESLNLATLWNLPCIFVIENNRWGMGTAHKKAIAAHPIADQWAAAFGIPSYTFDGMDFFASYAVFAEAVREAVETSRPILIEALTERFRGHSISDPGHYRSKEELAEAMRRDPILLFKKALIEEKMLQEDEFLQMDRQQKEVVISAMKFAEESPWPEAVSLEEGVFAPA